MSDEMIETATTDVQEWGELLHRNAREKGFYEYEDQLYRRARLDYPDDRRDIQNHWASRMTLIASEALEAFEELRSGHLPGDVYFRTADGKTTLQRAQPDGTLNKPEGVLMELTDVLIRTLETMYGILRQSESMPGGIGGGQLSTQLGLLEGASVDISDLIQLKHDYNTRRPRKHGREF